MGQTLKEHYKIEIPSSEDVGDKLGDGVLFKKRLAIGGLGTNRNEC